MNRHPSKSRHAAAKFFQPGEPENEADVYTSTTRRRTRSTTTLSSTTLLSTTETITTMNSTTTITSTTTTILPFTSTDTSPEITSQSDTTINLQPQPRKGILKGRHRRKNMTLYILTSDDHKIRQFSMNHTRGILINCNQLRRRLLGRRRRLRDISPLTSTLQTLIDKNSSQSIFPYHIYFLTILALYVL